MYEPMAHALSDKDRWLAAEYALGVLEREDLRLAEKRFEEEPLFRQAVEEWQNHLSPMLDEVGSVAPPPAVWDKIARRTAGAHATDQTGWWSSLAFWRGFSAVTGTLAAASLAALLVLPFGGGPDQPGTNKPLIATLTAAGQSPVLVARFDPQSGALFVRAALKDDTQARVPELWLIPDDGIPKSLGLLNRDGLADLLVSGENRALFGAGGTLAISLEPAGGSPTGAPTGPVIASGTLQPL